MLTLPFTTEKPLRDPTAGKEEDLENINVSQ